MELAHDEIDGGGNGYGQGDGDDDVEVSRLHEAFECSFTLRFFFDARINNRGGRVVALILPTSKLSGRSWGGFFLIELTIN